MTIALAILVVAVLLGAIGQVSLKTGLNELARQTAPAKPAPSMVIKSIFTQWQVTLGFMCYGISSLIYLVALSRLPVSYAYPMVALSYVIVTFLSWRVLHETVPLMRAAGLAVICIGVIVVALSFGPRDKAPAGPPAAVPTPIESVR